MPEILVLWPAGAPSPPQPVGCELRGYTTAAEVVAELAGASGSVVLCPDGLAGNDLTAVAEAVTSVEGTVIEVQGERWDGETHSHVSASCDGVIAGFGAAGVAAAVALLQAAGD